MGQLAQGIREVKGKNTVMFIPKSKVPKDKKVTYGKIVCEMKPEKEEKERTRLTVGGNLLDFTGNLSAPTASVTTEKCVFNSVVSTPGARCLLADIKHFISITSYQTLSLCGFLLKSSHRRSSIFMTSRHWLTTKGGYKCASIRECMASNRLA